MTDRPVWLDQHRGMAAQKATDIRRMVAEVEANAEALRRRQEDLEIQLLAGPSVTWRDAGEKARYLLTLFAASPATEDRRRKLIASVLEDFARLSDEDAAGDEKP